MTLLRKLFSRGKPSSAVGELDAPPLPDSPPLPNPVSIAELHELAAQRRFGEALRLMRLRNAASTQDREVAYARASTLFQSGRIREAAEAFRRASAFGRSSRPAVCMHMGWAYLHTGDVAAAEAAMADSVALEPTAAAYFGLGNVRHVRGNIAGAIASLERCLELDPGHVDACVLAGSCEMDRHDPAAAERYLRRGIAADSLSAACWLDLGVALEQLDRHHEALDAYREALRIEQLQGGKGGAVANVAVALRHTGRADEALGLLEADRHSPDPHRQYIHAAALFAVGKLAQAWEPHEFRWAFPQMLAKRAGLVDTPPWVGQELRDKTILLRAEQGIGDTIQFLRYAPWLKRLGARVHVRVQAPLVTLASRFHGVDAVQTPAGANAPVDSYIHPMSLPKVFGTALDTIPGEIPYVDIDEAAAARWEQRIPAVAELKVGIVWAGSPEHLRDRQRSIRLAALAPLLEVEGVRFHSLQKGPAERELASCEHAGRITDLAPDLSDFAETAAAISQLDLVICVDTSVAHLAGALGRPVWMLVPTPADARWMADRSDSPWYPSMRIFRQPSRGDWSAVIEEVKGELREIAGSRDRWPRAVRTKGSDAMPFVLRPASNVIPGRTRLTEARYGLLEYFADEPFVGPSIAFYGEYRQEELSDVLRRCPPGSTVLEIGAGIGWGTLALAIQTGERGHVIAYEHRPVHRAALLRNLANNGLRHVTVMLRSPVGAITGHDDSSAESVDDLQLDTLTWLLVSVEVDAVAALQGAAETLWRCRPSLLVRLAVPETLRRVADDVRAYGYRCWKLETPLYHADNFNRWAEDIFSGNTTVAVVAIPEEMDVTPGSAWVALD